MMMFKLKFDWFIYLTLYGPAVKSIAYPSIGPGLIPSTHMMLHNHHDL